MAGPQLLPKSVINADLATQRKIQIDQGVALAQKVDAIRETLQEEEKNLELFRANTIAKVQQEIDAKIRECEAEEQRLHRIRERISNEEAAIQERENIITKREKYLDERFKRLEEIISEL